MQELHLPFTKLALNCVDRLIHTHLLDLLDSKMEFLSSIDVSSSESQFFGEHKEFPSLMDTVKTLGLAGKLTAKYQMKRDIAVQGLFVSQSPRHQRTFSSPGDFCCRNDFLAIDDPVEDEDGTDGWYFGGNGHSSFHPTRNIDDTLSFRRGAINHNLRPEYERSIGSRHRRTFSTGSMRQLINGRTDADISSFSPSRSSIESSLFRLIVTLQLCLVRIEEANSVLCQGRATIDSQTAGNRSRSRTNSDLDVMFSSSSSLDNDVSSSKISPLTTTGGSVSWSRSHTLFVGGIGFGIILYCTRCITSSREKLNILKYAGKGSVVLASAHLARKRWRILCMNARVASSTESIEDWIFQWICLVHGNTGASEERQLIIPRKSNALWYSNGSIRFQLIKRGMDLLYASIGKAIEITRSRQESNETATSECKSSRLWTYVVASLAASFYNVIGPAVKSAQVISTSSQTVIQNAWGVVSLPAVKKVSLEATRILKGASIADRMEIEGVLCFILSREPFPALTSALRRFRRQQQREDARLSTIHEQVTVGHSSVNVKGFITRNVILHLTGGGFFAHTIAGDLPYLLDWSAATNAVVIIPEYALLPKHKFPDAITQITQIYRALRSGQAATLLGFQANKVIVSGESVGGNLASALCVTMIVESEENRRGKLVKKNVIEHVNFCDDTSSENEGEEWLNAMTNEIGLPLPDALMICCPALNLSLELTPSRLEGANDPVLPSGLIAAISDSYLPPDGEFPKTHPIASPYFASDNVLRQFCPTLIFTGSEDPFLDDSVHFNARLRSLGVNSRLRAVHDMPHAFWALSTAGIPEARQVQEECKEWLLRMFHHEMKPDYHSLSGLT